MKRVIATIALAALTGGCVISVDEVVPDHVSTFDPRLLGTWRGVPDSTDRAIVSRASDKGNTYAITFTDDEKSSKFEGRLGRLGGRTVMDVWPVPNERDVAEPYRGLLVPGHFLVVVDVEEDSLWTATLSATEMRKAIQTGILRLDTLPYNRQMVLRGATTELRAALSAYIGRPGALDKPELWRRVRRR
jgi:hypothetical protein